jgi:pimeloyl-ACP methyl ester carboxylesterase
MSSGQPTRAGMAGRGRAATRLIATLLPVLASILATAISSSDAQGASPRWLCSTGGPGLRMPVLLVHGFNSGPAAWTSSTRQYFASNQARTCIEVFDYADASTQWVTDHRIAPRLATTIDSLAEQSKAAGGPGKVIVIAHSMGGLATRCASAVSCSGVAGAGAHIAALVTLGTPTYGSFLKGSGASDVEHLVADIMSTDCFATGNGLGKLAGLCSLLRAFGTSAASAAFTPGSSQQKALNQVVMPFPVLALAGSVKIETSFFGHAVHLIGDAGDLVVSEDSALAASHQVGGLGGRVVMDCGSIDLSVVATDLRCWHGSEPNDPDFDTAALEEITKVENFAQYGSYLGLFHSHDDELCIGQALDLTPTTAAHNPPCSGDSTSGWERLWGCGYPAGGCGYAWIALSFSPQADGTVTATPSAAPVPVPSPVGSPFYDDGLTVCTLSQSGKIVPCSGVVIPPEGLAVTQQLSLMNGGVLKVTLPQGYYGGASYDLCGASASQAVQQRYCPNG